MSPFVLPGQPTNSIESKTLYGSPVSSMAMNHVSPQRSASTAAASFSPGSDTTCQPEAPRYQYTTAGTIYNPDAVQPIQPPTRRSRGFKWSLHQQPPSETSPYQQSLVDSLNLGPSSIPRTNPANSFSPAIPQYSPLQQNYDRAVSPAHRSKLAGEVLQATETIPTSIQPLTASATVRNTRLETTPSAMPSNRFAMDWEVARETDPYQDSQLSSDDDLADSTISRMTVKSLHNLASYPNPNQKKAQRALRRGRTAVSPLPSNPDISGSSTPRPRPNPYTASDLKGMGNNTLSVFPPSGPRLRDAEVDGLEYSSGNSRINNSKDVRSMADKNFGRNGSYRSTLASGPGAPQPLTAGPPGQRQYKSSTFDTAFRALQNNSRTLTTASEESTQVAAGFRVSVDGTNEKTRLDYVEQSVGGGLPVSPMPPGDAWEPSTSSLLASLRESSVPDEAHVLAKYSPTSAACSLLNSLHIEVKVQPPRYDTKSSHEVRQYYPDGFPNSGFEKKIHLEPDWLDEYPIRQRSEWKLGTCHITDAELEKRNNRISQQFYAGSEEIGRSMEEVITDAKIRQLQRDIGIIGDKRQQQITQSRAPRHKISVEEAKRMTVAQAAEPLTTMVYSTLLNCLEATNQKSQRGGSRQRAG